MQNVFHCVGGLYFALVGQMRVNIRRGGKGAMPQPFLYGFHRNARRQQQARTTVPEIMEPDHSHVVLFQQLRKRAGDVVWLNGLAPQSRASP